MTHLKKTTPFLVLFLVGCKGGLSEEQQKDLLSKLETAVATAERQEAARAKAIPALVQQPAVSASRCEEVVMLNSLGRPTNNGRLPTKGDGNFVHAESIDELAKQTGTRIAKIRKDAKLLRSQITGKDLVAASPFTEETIGFARDRIAQLSDPGWYRYDIHYVVRKLESNLEKDGKKYPSFVAGRAIVWDYKEGKVACTADAQQSAAGGVRVTYDRRKGPTARDREAAYKYYLLNEAQTAAMKAIGLGLHYASQWKR